MDLQESLELDEQSAPSRRQILAIHKSPDNDVNNSSKIRHSTPISALNSSSVKPLNDVDEFLQSQIRQTRHNLLSPEMSNPGAPVMQQTAETKKSIDTLMISQTGGGYKMQNTLPSNHTSVMNNTGRLNQTGGVIFKTFGNFSPEQIAEQQSSLINPGTASKPFSPDFEQSRQTHILGSLQSSQGFTEYSQKNAKQRLPYGGGNKIMALLGSTLDGTRGKVPRSKQMKKLEPKKEKIKYDMTVGIKSKMQDYSPNQEDIVSKDVSSGQDTVQPVTVSVRKTVTLDLASNSSKDIDQLTQSVGSISQYDKLNSSVQTSEYLDLVQDGDLTRIETRHPTVISIIDTQRRHDTEPDNQKDRKLSPIDNLMLGTAEASGKRFQIMPRTGRSKINQEQEFLDHLLNTCDEKGSEQQNMQQSLEMIKLRKVLMTAMQMNSTSVDKKWSQMTPFERSKIKDCFTELLHDLSKQERRVQRARGVLDSGKGGAQINMLTTCLTSQKVKQQQRPLPTNPNIDLTWDGCSARSRDYETQVATFQIMPTGNDESFILVNNEMNLPSTTHLLGQKKNSLHISYESMLPRFGGRRRHGSQSSGEPSSGSIKVSLQKSGKSLDYRKNLNTNSQFTETDIEIDEQDRKIPITEPQSPLYQPMENERQRDTILQYATMPQNILDSTKSDHEDGHHFQTLVTARHVSMEEINDGGAENNDLSKGQVIDLSTNYDATSVAVKNAIDLGKDSLLNSTLLSFLSMKQESSPTGRKQRLPAKKATAANAAASQNVDVQRLTSMAQPMVELPSIVKMMHNQMVPWQKQFGPIKEEPDKIVESTLQAISLTKQYQFKSQPMVHKNESVKQVKPQEARDEEKAKKIVINQDQFHGVKVIKDLETSQAMFQDALLLEMHNLVNLNGASDEVNKNGDTSTIHNIPTINSGPLNSMSKFSEPNFQSNENIRLGQDSTMVTALNIASDEEEALELRTAKNPALVTQVFKSPTHNQLKDSPQSCTGLQKIIGSRFDHSPSQNISNNTQQVAQIDSATEKSSLYPQYMISKLDQSKKASPQKQNIKRNKAPPAQQNSSVPSKEVTHQPTSLQNAKQPSVQTVVESVLTPQEPPQQTFSPPPQPAQKIVSSPPKRQNRAFRGQLNEKKRASAIAGWDHQTLSIGNTNQQHGQSQADMLADLQQRLNNNHSSRHALRKYNSIEAKLQLLEARIAEHELEQVAICPSGKLDKFQISIKQGGALRRSALKGKNTPHEIGLNFRKKKKVTDAAAMASLKLCGIRGTSKDLLNPQTYKLMGGIKSTAAEPGPDDDDSSSLTNAEDDTGTAVLLTVENKEGLVVHCFDGLTLDDEDQAAKARGSEQRPHQKLLSPQLAHQLSGLPYVDEGMFYSKKKSHNVSLANLPLYPGQDAVHFPQGMLNSPSKPSMIVGLINNLNVNDNLSNYQVPAGTLTGTFECLSDSRLNYANPFKTEKKVQGTQAFAATPSMLTESANSLGLLGALVNQKKQVMPVLLEADAAAIMKMNQTTTSAFSPPGDQLRLELMQAGAVDILIAATNSEDELKMPPDQERQSFLINEIASLEFPITEEDGSAPQVSTRDQAGHSPKIKEHDFSAAQLASGAVMIGTRSQSLAPPIAKMQLDNSNVRNNRIYKGAMSSLRKRSIFMQAKLSSQIVRSPSQKTNDSGQASAEQQIFDPDIAPRQQLPKMKSPSVLDPSVGMKQDTRTPLHKLLTSDQLEEFQSLLGSKQKWRKYRSKQGVQAELALQSIDQTFMIQPRLRQTVVRPQLVASQDSPQLPELKANITKSMPHNIADFLNSSFSKQNTVEHIKRVKNTNASRHTKVVFIDPILGTVRPDLMQSTHQPLSPQETHLSSTKKQKKKQMMLQTVTKNRASPFQTHGPFSSMASPKSIDTSPQKTGRTRNTSDLLNTTMPSMPAVSNRYRSTKHRKQSEFSQTFIFNDVNNLKKDLRKNQALIYRSNQH